MVNAIELKNVNKEYKNFKLKDINFNVPKGYIMGFIGENGAGKTTTINLILDLINKKSGEIKIFGEQNINILNDIKENIGVVLDDCFFSEDLSCKNIALIMKNIYKTWDEKKFNKYVNDFSIPKSKCISEFSRGQKTKLSIAVALSHDTKLLILDEATNGLDPIIKDEILDIFLQFVENEENTIFISSHILSDLEKVCDYITFIHKGYIILSDEKDKLKEKYVLLKCTEKEFETIDSKSIVGYRKNRYGVEALVLNNKIYDFGVTDKASLEDIMVYSIKGGIK